MVDISSPRAGRERLASRPPASATYSPVPARDDENSAPALRIPAPREERSGGSRTGMLDHQSCPVEVGLGRLLDRGIIDRDDLVDEFSDMLEGQVTWPDHSEPIGDGLPASDRRRLPLLERSLHRRGIGWLDADHLTIGLDPLDPCSDTRDQTTPTDRDEDGIDLRPLFDDLLPNSPLTGDHLEVVEGRDDRGRSEERRVGKECGSRGTPEKRER